MANGKVDLDVVGIVSRLGREMGVLDGDESRRRVRGSFGVEFWASHCN